MGSVIAMPPEPELPRLSSADLAALFGDDVVALKRYRMLVALLREGRPAGEVARTFGVSRESLRRLRRTFARGSLEALQSRRRGGGHFVRGSPLAQALRQELSADPGVPASVLWQRVRARLREIGAPAPRSTFYRLLARLRDEESVPAEGSASMRLLREALGSLIEDPPLTLGRSQLAELLLPDERDPLLRGRRLAAALRSAIQRLRPAEAGPVLDDPRWRHYLIIAGEYEAGEERGDLQGTLALSASTYSRAKREALERLIALLPSVLDDTAGEKLGEGAPAAPPPASEPHGREAELELYMARLRREGLALIWSPPDDHDEPSELAAALAARLTERGQTVIWHACRPPAPGEQHAAAPQLVATLAAALAHAGRRDLRDIAGAAPLGPALIERLAAALRGRYWTLVIAGCQWLAEDDAAGVLGTLLDARERRDIRLVLAGDALPAWADAERWPPLPDPDDAAARRLFFARLGGAPAARPSAMLPVLPALASAAQELADLLPPEAMARLSPEQRAQVLDALAPADELLKALRAGEAS